MSKDTQQASGLNEVRAKPSQGQQNPSSKDEFDDPDHDDFEETVMEKQNVLGYTQGKKSIYVGSSSAKEKPETVPVKDEETHEENPRQFS